MAVLLALTGALAACGRKAATPLGPVPGAPLEVVDLFPAPRSTGIVDGTEIWARFDEDLDPATLNDQTVTLRLDARYIPIAIAWDSTERKVRIRPQELLALLRTHTVRLGSGITSRSGVPLAKEYSWQFKTSGVRLPDLPAPADGTEEESPFVRLAWRETGAIPGVTSYTIYASVDSAAVASRRAAAVASRATPAYLPRQRWPYDTTIYWSVTVRNSATGESVDGPAWRFRTLRADAPVDSIELPLSDWSFLWRDDNHNLYEECLGETFESGYPALVCAIRWDLRSYPAYKLAGATMIITRGRGDSLTAVTEIYSSADYWSACDLNLDGAPHRAERLASGSARRGESMFLSTDALTAHLEAMLRYEGYYGYVVECSLHQDYVAAGCRLILRFFSERGGAGRPQ